MAKLISVPCWPWALLSPTSRPASKGGPFVIPSVGAEISHITGLGERGLPRATGRCYGSSALAVVRRPKLPYPQHRRRAGPQDVGGARGAPRDYPGGPFMRKEALRLALAGLPVLLWIVAPPRL